jgi:hypothetical protein
VRRHGWFGVGQIDLDRLGTALRGEFDDGRRSRAEVQHEVIVQAMNLDPLGLTTAFRWARIDDLPGAIRIQKVSPPDESQRTITVMIATGLPLDAAPLEASAESPAPARLSTKVDSVWTFSSSHVDAQTPLPAMGIGYSALLDDHNTARAGSLGIIPLTMSYRHGTSAPTLTALSVDISYDDGATWQRATVAQVGGRWLMTTKYTNRAGFVSLRAQATDSAGNIVRQTIIRAFELR